MTPCDAGGRAWARSTVTFDTPATERTVVPRKPNYKFERHERDRAKALKKAERPKMKQERAEQKKLELEQGARPPAEQAAAEQTAAEQTTAEPAPAEQVAAEE